MMWWCCLSKAIAIGERLRLLTRVVFANTSRRCFTLQLPPCRLGTKQSGPVWNEVELNVSLELEGVDSQ